MSEIYKVTNAKITTSKNGYAIFNLELNKKIWAGKLAPIRKTDQKYSKLYQIYEEKNTLDSVIGKFITTSLEKTQYGVNFDYIESYDSLEDFRELLDKAEKKAFSTSLSIYQFLKSQSYNINNDNSITLKKPYNYFNIREKNSQVICYPNNLKLDELTFDNIEKIYYQFYDKKFIDTGNPDRDCHYKLTTVAIVKNCKKYHKTKGKTLSDTDSEILTIGDKLNDKYIEYLSTL
jgi:hypothetical protein